MWCKKEFGRESSTSILFSSINEQVKMPLVVIDREGRRRGEIIAKMIDDAFIDFLFKKAKLGPSMALSYI